ncbi:MAG: fumarylacetoacetate hydrolase family protein [Flavitalea sp.]
MQLYKISTGNILLHNDKAYNIKGEWDELINQPNLYKSLLTLIGQSATLSEQEYKPLLEKNVLAPIGQQEVWASGVTYLKSRDARMEESKDKGGADCYQRVYEAERPELFFKALPHRVSGHLKEVYIRKDSTWNVPEPELTLFINSWGSIQAYTVGNDMSSRSIEGENPLYLPQAKMYEKCAALGPCLYIPEQPIHPETNITLSIERKEEEVFHGVVAISRMKRKLSELADWLFRECSFAHGCFLMTGTGLVPPDHFTLETGDIVRITIDGIGTLVNAIATQP